MTVEPTGGHYGAALARRDGIVERHDWVAVVPRHGERVCLA